MTNIQWVVMHLSWEWSWIVHFSRSRIPHEDLSPRIEVYENIFLLEPICCEHPESITIYLCYWSICLNVPLIFSPFRQFMTLPSCCFFLRVQQSVLMCPFCDTSCTINFCVLSYSWNFHYYSSFIKWACPESSRWDSHVNWLSILSLLSDAPWPHRPW